MRVLFAYDGSPFAKRALRYGTRLGDDLEAVVITVSPVLIEAPHTEEYEDPTRDTREARRQLEEAQKILAEDVPALFLFQLPKLGVWNAKLKGLWENTPIPSNDVTEAYWVD